MNEELIYTYPIISLGSPFGIGYEIFLLTIKKKSLNKYYPLICVGSNKIVNLFLKLLKIKINYISILSLKKETLSILKEKKYKFILIDIDKHIDIKKFKLEKIPNITPYLDGLIAYNSIVITADLVKNGFFKSVVTLPVNKKNINQIDTSFKGHTEFLQKKWKEKHVYMTFISDLINVMLLTTHIPMNHVAKYITKKTIKESIEYSLKLKNKLKLKKQICFLGLNPHAGENGLIGKEDSMIKEVIQEYNNSQIVGPLPSDTVFTKDNIKKFDIFISCYHDQGLIPFKMLAFDNGVNLSFGMKYIRTSVDHGTGIDLIGKKNANLNSFINAYKLAIKLS